MKNIPSDLLFIAKHVTEWPKRQAGVRLDMDGEICFSTTTEDDFFVESKGKYEIWPGKEHPEFISAGGMCFATGKDYTRKQWEEARNEIRMLSR